jgi:GDP/UDP-N,N'-diacetylbacillosamine 2-epimerase (hydrolysing)
MKKVLAISTIRSDYDLMSPLYQILHNDSDIDFKILVAGAHMSYSYGYSHELIEKDGFEIIGKIETLIDSHSSRSRLKSASNLLISSIDIVNVYLPDLIIFAGDREDTIMSALIGSYLKIPTIHFYGGDHATDGHVDNPVRHAVSKLSSLHFVATKRHKERLIRIGESPKRIFVIGAISLDKLLIHNDLPLEKIKRTFKINNGFNEYALMIFHPNDKEMEESFIHFENILKVLKKRNINTFISYPNVDPGNKKIIEVISKYENDSCFRFYKSLERSIFLTLFNNAKFLIGNSSAGIIEAASMKIPVINVGLRQKGRDQSGNVIYCNPEMNEINDSINVVKSKEFINSISNIKNIYGDGKSSKRAYNLIKKLEIKKYLYKTEDPLFL